MSLVEWYSGLGNMKKLVLTIIGVVILAILVNLISMIDLSEKIVDYKTLSLEEVKSNYELNSDKDIYVKSDEIIKNLMLTSIDKYEIQGKKVKINDFFKYSKYSEYKISKLNFRKLVNNISKDVLKEKDTSSINWEDIYPVINNIYTYSGTYKMYIVELNTEIPHAIGIKYTSENTFYIFYLE